MNVVLSKAPVSTYREMDETNDSVDTTMHASVADINKSHLVQFEHLDSIEPRTILNQADKTSKISSCKSACTVFSKIIFTPIHALRALIKIFVSYCTVACIIFSKILFPTIKALLALIKIIFTCIYTAAFVATGIVLVGPVTVFSTIKQCVSQNQHKSFIGKDIIELTKELAHYCTMWGVLSPVFVFIGILNCCGLHADPFYQPIIEKISLVFDTMKCFMVKL